MLSRTHRHAGYGKEIFQTSYPIRASHHFAVVLSKILDNSWKMVWLYNEYTIPLNQKRGGQEFLWSQVTVMYEQFLLALETQKECDMLIQRIQGERTD